MHPVLISELMAIFVVVTCFDQSNRVWERMANLGSSAQLIWIIDGREHRPGQPASSYG